MKLAGPLRTLLISLLASACGDARMDRDASQSILDGQWESGCVAADESIWRMSSYEFSFGSKGERKDVYFADEDCQDPQYQSSYQGEYSIAVTFRPKVYLLELKVLASSSLVLAEGGSLELCQSVSCPRTLAEGFTYKSQFYYREDLMVTQSAFGSSNGDERIDLANLPEDGRFIKTGP